MRSEPSSGYRFALTRPGVRTFTSAGFVARLPIAMNALAIVLLVSNTTGSYAYAGVLSALLAVTAGLVSILTSRLADRIGQARVVRVLAIAHSGLLVVFTISILADLPRVLQVVLVLAAGASTPAIGSYVRARWTHTSVDASMLRVGFAWESILDEVIFTIGPILTTALAFSVGFASPLFLASGLVLIGSLALAASKSTEPPAHRDSVERSSLWAVLRTPGLTSLVIAAMGLGIVFGTIDVGVVAFTAEQGSGAFAGFILATFAATSMIGGISYGARDWPGPLRWHTRMAAGALALVTLGFPLATSNVMVMVVAGLAGFSVAPALIGIFTLASRLVPRRHLTEGLTWTNSGLAVGFALGSSASGIVVDAYGARAGLTLSVLGAVAAIAALADRALARADAPDRPELADGPGQSDGPVNTWNDDPLPGPHLPSSP